MADAMNGIYNPPVAGASGKIALDGTDKTVTLNGTGSAGLPRVLALTAQGGDAFWAIGADATASSNANAAILLDGSTVVVFLPGGAPVLHATQGPAQGGNLYYSVS